jgi:cytochrome c oxidase subunit 3
MLMQVTLSDKEILRDKTEYVGVHPQKFMLWIAMASMTMFFAALTSALLIKKGDFRVWENFRMPGVFIYSTFTIIAVSVVMQLALHSYRKAMFARFRTLLGLSFFLAIVFLLLQLRGWQVLMQMGMPINGNVAGQFIYLLTSMHGLHIVGGLTALLVVLIGAIRSRKDPIYELRDIINPKRQLNLELLVGFWHYIDAVWIYLFFFMYINY